VRADLFNRAAWQLRTRAGARVFAWMPVLAFELPGTTVQAHGAAASAPGAPARYRRLSVFDPQARQTIREIYDDLGRHASFAGVLFHDDAFLGDDEDASAPALAAYASWGLPGDVDAIRASADLRARWAAGKTRALTDFTLELAQILRRWQPELLTARNFYARPVLEPAAREWFAQDFAADLARYDYCAIMAMPAMEQARDADDWLRQLAKAALAAPDAAGHTVFELQARDWRTGQPVPDARLQQQALLLRRLGARHLAYYPDDAQAGRPGLETARANFSVSYLIEDALRRELAAPAAEAGSAP
jgi:biofilm PGA synthesis lipoprotein PgaB